MLAGTRPHHRHSGANTGWPSLGHDQPTKHRPGTRRPTRTSLAWAAPSTAAISQHKGRHTTQVQSKVQGQGQSSVKAAAHHDEALGQ